MEEVREHMASLLKRSSGSLIEEGGKRAPVTIREEGSEEGSEEGEMIEVDEASAQDNEYIEAVRPPE